MPHGPYHRQEDEQTSAGALCFGLCGAVLVVALCLAFPPLAVPISAKSVAVAVVCAF